MSVGNEFWVVHIFGWCCVLYSWVGTVLLWFYISCKKFLRHTNKVFIEDGLRCISFHHSIESSSYLNRKAMYICMYVNAPILTMSNP
jgi:hypothetical protein